MKLAWSTIVVLLFLLPGFLFLVGVYSSNYVSRDVAAWKTPGQLAGVLSVAFSIHAAIFVFFNPVHGLFYGMFPDTWSTNVSVFFDQLKQLATIGSVANRDVVEVLAKVCLVVIGYVVVTSALGFIVGTATSKLIAKGKLRFLVKHGWAYDLITTMKDGYAAAYVLTRIQSDHRLLMYKGGLTDFLVAPDGRILYLLLSQPERYCMVLDEPPTTTDPSKWLRVSAPNGRLLIEGTDIANIVFAPESLKKTESGDQLLTNELAKVASRIRKQLREQIRANAQAKKKIAKMKKKKT